MPTKAEIARFRQLQALGCVCCLMLGFHSAPDIHHILSGGRRMGHMFTLPICPMHHRGVLPEGYTRDTAAAMFGPSLADGSKPFHARFGSQQSLLILTNELLQTQVYS